MNDKFVPTKHIWVIVANERYDEKRKFTGYSELQDIPEVRNDAVNAKNGFQGLGARPLDTHTIADADFTSLKELFRNLTQNLNANDAQNEKTMVFFYYAGHGLQDNFTMAVLNEEKNYPLEKQLRTLANVPNSFIVGLFDCCRQRIMSSAMRGSNEPAVEPEEEN